MIKYRSMKHFNVEEYSRYMNSAPFHLYIFDDMDDILGAQEQLVTSALDSHAPLKQRCIKNGRIPFMNTILRKAKMNMWRSGPFGDERNPTAREKYLL